MLLITDRNISLRAKGLYFYIQNLKSKNANINIQILADDLKEGKQAIRNAISELENSGYLQRKPIKCNGRFTGYDYILLKG